MSWVMVDDCDVIRVINRTWTKEKFASNFQVFGDPFSLENLLGLFGPDPQ